MKTKKKAPTKKKLVAKNEELKKTLADVRDQLTTSEKKRTAKNKELKKTLADVRDQLTKSENKLAKARGKVERWKEESAAQRTEASRSAARAEKLQKKLDRAANAAQPTQAKGPVEATASDVQVAEPTTSDEATVPDHTWSVVQLKAEARARGLVGLSNKPKAELIAALS